MTDRNYDQGSRVTFAGGTGRGDEGTLTVGIVNGPAIANGGVFYVPVHVPETNHNVMVLSTNIVAVARP